MNFEEGRLENKKRGKREILDDNEGQENFEERLRVGYREGTAFGGCLVILMLSVLIGYFTLRVFQIY